MLTNTKIAAVLVIISTTIAAQAVLALWSQKLTYAGTPLGTSVEASLGWTLVIVALIATTLVVGPKHERIWAISLLVLFVIVVGGLLVSQFALGIQAFRRDYTSSQFSSCPGFLRVDVATINEPPAVYARPQLSVLST